jgi:4-diphosphocytidyl-2C-methyl-D-erythritol kinase
MERKTEYALAKLNLSLSVLGLVKNLHKLEMINIPIPFYDILTFEFSDKDELVCSYNIPDNIILKALELFRTTFKLFNCVKIYLIKIIPIGSGLGGESADAAATLRGLRRLFKLNIPIEDLEPLAVKLGSDVKFCLYNRCALVTGTGQKINFLPMNNQIKQITLILTKINVSTSLVFKNHHGENKTNPSTAKVFQKDLTLFLEQSQNTLTQTTVMLYPDLLLLSKIKNVRMSGSGSSFFIVNPNQSQLLNVSSLGYLIITLPINQDPNQ